MDMSSRREQDLEAQIAALKQDKERLLGLLEQALTALNQSSDRAPARDPAPLPSSLAYMAPRRATKQKEEFVPGTWAWLKNWFFNA